MRRAGAHLAAAALLVGAGGCGGGSTVDGGEAPSRVDRIGSYTVTDSEFEIFLQRELGDASIDVDAAARRRMYEEFIASLLMARAAEKEGLEAHPAAIDEEMEKMRDIGIDAADEEMALYARRALLARAYERKVLLPAVSVPPEDVEKELGLPATRRAREFVVFRQVRVADRATADQAFRRVTRQRESFEQVARELSTAPDRGAVQQRALNDLPRETADVLRRLPENAASRPIEVEGSYYLFQVEARNRDPDPGRALEREEVRRRLFQARLDELKERKLAELAASEGIRVPRLVGDSEEPSR